LPGSAQSIVPDTSKPSESLDRPTSRRKLTKAFLGVNSGSPGFDARGWSDAGQVLPPRSARETLVAPKSSGRETLHARPAARTRPFRELAFEHPTRGMQDVRKHRVQALVAGNFLPPLVVPGDRVAPRVTAASKLCDDYGDLPEEQATARRGTAGDPREAPRLSR
jgi:hypothetical protein